MCGVYIVGDNCTKREQLQDANCRHDECMQYKNQEKTISTIQCMKNFFRGMTWE